MPLTKKPRGVFGNIVKKNDLRKKLTVCFDELTTILREIAGPFANDAIIGSKWRQHNDVDEFSKDGIKVLRHLIVGDEAESRLAARLARFVGIAVDKRCHDGTTTSMLLFSYLASSVLDVLSHGTFDRRRYALVKQWKSVLEDINAYLGELRITDEELLEKAKEFGIETNIPEIRGAIAYHMAMISSKGDHDLSEKISFVIKTCPKNIYGVFNPSSMVQESKERYILEKQEYDLSIPANLQNLNDYNYKNNTQYLSENAVIFMTGSEIATHSMESMFLNAFISRELKYRSNLGFFNATCGWEELHHGKRNLIIMAPQISDHELLSNIMLFNRDNPNCKISSFIIQGPAQLRTSLNKTLHYMAGYPTFQDVTYTDPVHSLVGLREQDGLEPVRIHLLGHQLSISNLYKKTDGIYHPFYSDPEAYEPYTRFREETEALIEMCMKNITHAALEPDEVTKLTVLYRCLTCQEIYNIQVGGSIHEQYANRTVYEDAIGAAMSAVEEGLVLGGYGHILKWIMMRGAAYEAETSLVERIIRMISPEAQVLKSVETALLSTLVDSLRFTDRVKISQMIEEELEDKWHYLVASPKDYLMGNDYIHVTSLCEDSFRSFLACKPGLPVLTQSWSGYDEQFNRCLDILPKLANTALLADMRAKEGEDFG